MGWYQNKTSKLQQYDPQDPGRSRMNRVGRPRAESCGEEGKGERRGAITKPRLSDSDRERNRPPRRSGTDGASADAVGPRVPEEPEVPERRSPRR